MSETFDRAHDWRRACAGLLAVLTSLVLLVLLASFAIAQGRFAGPPINLQIGSYHVLSRTTTSATCQPLTVGCAAPLRAENTPSFYTIWVLTVSETPIPGGLQEQLTSTRLLTLPIRP